MKQKPFEVGDEVAVLHHDGRVQRKRRVAKVYKTGNFVLDDDTNEQWRPNGRRASDGWNQPRVEHWTDEHAACLRAATLRRSLHNLVESKEFKQLPLERLEDMMVAAGLSKPKVKPTPPRKRREQFPRLVQALSDLLFAVEHRAGSPHQAVIARARSLLDEVQGKKVTP